MPMSEVRLFHDHGAVEFRLRETVVRIALGLLYQTIFRDAIFIHQKIVHILHTLLRKALVQLLTARSLVGRSD